MSKPQKYVLDNLIELNKKAMSNPHADFENPTQVLEHKSNVTYKEHKFEWVDFEAIMKRNHRYKETFANALSLYQSLIKGLEKVDGKYPVIPISHVSHTLLYWMGSIDCIAKTLKFLKNNNLLTIDSNFFRFNHSENIAKTYIINLGAFRKLEEICKNQGIKPKKANKHIIESKEFEELYLTSRCSIPAEDPKTIEARILKTYPFLKELFRAVDEANSKLDDLSLCDKCQITVRFNRKRTKITKIGFRISNSNCNLRKNERVEILKKNGLTIENDITSSILSITYALNNGYWAKNIDFYEKVYACVPGHKRPFKDIRDDFKACFCRGYFAKTLREIASKLKFSSGDYETDIEYDVAALKHAVKCLGTSFDVEIFAIESYLTFMVKQELLSKGYKVLQVYDCFYTDQSFDLEDMLSRHFNRFYNKYRKWILKSIERHSTKVVGFKNTQTSSLEETSKNIEANTSVLISNISNGFENPSKSKVLIDSQTAVIDSSFHSESKQLIDNRLNFKFNISKHFNSLSQSSKISPIVMLSQDSQSTTAVENCGNSKNTELEEILRC
jgi:hypothetical protein